MIIALIVARQDSRSKLYSAFTAQRFNQHNWPLCRRSYWFRKPTGISWFLVAVWNSLKFQYHMLVLAIILASITALICNEIMHSRYSSELNAHVIYIYMQYNGNIIASFIRIWSSRLSNVGLNPLINYLVYMRNLG